MYIGNTSYHVYTKNNKIENPFKERTPTLFDFISDNVKVVDGKIKVKDGLEKNIKNTKDVVLIPDDALKERRNMYIENSLKNGEPMKDISFDEFVFYYFDKDGFTRDEKFMRQLYSQAQKGWKASCAEHEWRTNPNYIFRMSSPMFDSPEMTEDREAAFEKLKNGGKLTQIEKDLLDTFPDFDEGCRRVNEVRQELYQKSIQQRMLDKMSGLSPDDEITFTVWGYKILDVQGTVSDEKLAAIKEAMTDEAKNLYNIYQNSADVRAMSKGTGYQFGQFIEAQRYLELAGGGSLLDITKDEDGNYHGIPKELDDFLRKNKNFNGVNEREQLQAFHVSHAFDKAIEAVEAGRYEWFMSKIGKITYKNGEFFA